MWAGRGVRGDLDKCLVCSDFGGLSPCYLHVAQWEIQIHSQNRTIGKLQVLAVIVVNWVKLSGSFHPPTHTVTVKRKGRGAVL